MPAVPSPEEVEGEDEELGVGKTVVCSGNRGSVGRTALEEMEPVAAGVCLVESAVVVAILGSVVSRAVLAEVDRVEKIGELGIASQSHC